MSIFFCISICCSYFDISICCSFIFIHFGNNMNTNCFTFQIKGEITVYLTVKKIINSKVYFSSENKVKQIEFLSISYFFIDYCFEN